jgi:hypothetical protein
MQCADECHDDAEPFVSGKARVVSGAIDCQLNRF